MINQILLPIQKEMQLFNELYNSLLYHNNEYINNYLQHLSTQKGKQIRPTLVFLSAAMNGNISTKTYSIALAVELLHLSSLVHDDVVDEGLIRRNNPTINAKYGNQVAVLVGDLLLSKCIQKVLETNDYQLLNKFTQIAEDMTIGELLQLKFKEIGSLIEKDYFSIIKNKTAALFKLCFSEGAKSGNANLKEIKSWEDLGLNFGLLFQMCDDLADFCTKNPTKDAFKDIKEHKITFPIIATLQSSNIEEQKSLLDLFAHHQGTAKEINTIIEYVKQKNGILRSMEMINDLKNNIYQFLYTFPPSVYRTAMLEIVERTIKSIN